MPPRKPELSLDLAHFSMLYSNTAAQWQRNAEKIFTRGYDWVTGTEAGENPGKAALAAAAESHGYHFVQFKSNWIAVRKSIVAPGTYRTSTRTVVENDLVVGPGHDVNIVGAHFTHPSLGKINVLASHYPTKGKPDGKTPVERRNLQWTKKIAHAIGDLTVELGEGKSLVFYGGDQNIVDRYNDTFFGEPLTSAWDELKRWENTGHGNIDVIASYDRDTRVRATYVRALDDRELPFYSDHFPVEAGYKVRAL